MKPIVVSFAILLCSQLLVAQTNYRTIASGSWHNTAVWESDSNNDGIYENSPALATPDFNDGTILIRNGHVVAVFQNVTIDQTTVESTGRISIAPVTVTVANGAGSDLVNFGRVSSSDITRLVFSDGAEFVHAKNGGELPLATWNTNSICSMNGITTGAPSGINLNSFYHFRWNSPGQLTTVNLNNNLINVQGNLEIQNTNNFVVSLSSSSALSTVNIGGDLIISGTSKLLLTNSANLIVNVAGNLDYSASGTGLSFVTHTGNPILNVSGDILIDAVGGTVDLSSGSGIGTINLAGDFTLTNGTVTEVSSGSGGINFMANGTQLFTNSGSITNQVHYSIGANSILDTQNESALTGGGTLTVNGSLRLGSLNATGAITTGSVGNVRVFNRIYNSGARIIYGGNGPQFMGNGQPLSALVTTEIENLNGVTFNTTTTGNSGSSTMQLTNLVLTSGNLNIASTASVTRTLRLTGTVVSGGNVSVSGSLTNIEITGNGDLGTFPNVAGQTIRSLTINRSTGGLVTFADGFTVSQTTSVQDGELRIGGPTVFSGPLILGASSLLSFQNESITIGNNFTTSGGTLSSNASSTLTITGGLVLTSPLDFSLSGNTLGTLTINKSNGGASLIVDSPLTVTNSLNLIDGELNISSENLSLSSGSTLTLASVASISGSSPSGGPWNLVYTQGSCTTGLELPASGVIESLTINNSSGATVTLDQDLTVNTFINIPNAGRNFNCRNNNLTLGGDIINEGNFGAPFGVGTLIFNGDNHITGSVMPLFFNIRIQGTLTSPANFSLRGNFTNNGTFVAGSGTVTFTGLLLQSINGSSPTTFNNISVTNTTQPVSVSVNSNQNLRGTLTLSSNSVFDADGASNTSVFTLLSDSNGDAGIATLPANASVIGQVTVQRFIPALDNVYRYISSPLTDIPVSQLQDDFAVTGSFTGTSHPCTGCTNNGPSLRYYHEPNNGVFSNGYAATPATNGTNAETLVEGRGYSAYMWNGVSDFTIDLTGTINTGPLNYTVQHTVSNPVEPTADGWNLIGNPYPSAIQWIDGPGWSRSNVDQVVWVWDVQASVWRTYDATLNTGDLTDGIIASGQGFWVYVAPGAASLSINESAKVNNGGAYYRKKQNSVLTASLSQSGTAFKENAFLLLPSEEIGQRNNSPKLQVGIEKMSLAFLDVNGNRMGYYVAREPGDIPLSISVADAGKYTISFSGFESSDELSQFYLVDSHTQTVKPISEKHDFVVESGYKIDTRFWLTRNPEGVEMAGDVVEIEVYPNPTRNTINVLTHTDDVQRVLVVNTMGDIVNQKEIGTGRLEEGLEVEFDLSSQPSGVYFIRIIKVDKSIRNFKIVKQ